MADRDELRHDKAHDETDRARRKFLLLAPLGVGAGIMLTLITAAARFLRPQVTSATGATTNQWLPVAPLAELTGTEPLARTVSVQQELGWTQVREEHPVIVLPREQRVLSAVCPHEGCAVTWRADAQEFLCPCHDSHFNSAGARTSGPAARGLDQLPTQVENGVLKVRWPATTEPNQTVNG
ncbi:MAG TPA: ubiquinol-cytochrome c reductase iron-sulfur subunit [Pyrinomonadaceae bacterium]|nr:ubiquinol-cytochrome c reductase iron-sulfur subunit [Pyrinomonadaceae bacterium]